MTRRSVRALCVIVACLLGPVSLCSAQAGLPPAIVQASALTPEMVAQIQQYIEEPLKNLASDDNDAIKTARNTLLAPLRERGVSVSFRQKYSQLLIPKLKPLTTGTRDQVYSNALSVVGGLATTEAVELLGLRLGEKMSPPVRVFAAGVCARFFEQLDPNAPNASQPAVLPGDLQALADKLGDNVLNDAHPDGLDAAVRALLRGASVTRNGFEAVRKHCLTVLCRQAIARSKTPEAWPQSSTALPALLRAQIFLREAIGQAAAGLALTPEETKLVLTVQVRMIVWISENLKEIAQGKPEDRQLSEQSIRVAEIACAVAFDKLNVGITTPKMADEFKKGTPEGDREFFKKVLDLQQQLTPPPLNLGPFGR